MNSDREDGPIPEARTAPPPVPWVEPASVPIENTQEHAALQRVFVTKRREPHLRDLAYAVFLILVIQIVSAMAIPNERGQGSVKLTPGLLLIFTFSFAFAVLLSSYLFNCLKYRRSIDEAFALVRVPRRVLVWSAVMGFFSAMVAITGIIIFLPPQSASAPIDEVVSSGGIFAAFAVLALLAPLVEEPLFRGFMLPVLIRKWGRLAGVAITTLIFAALHGIQINWQPACLLIIYGFGLLLSMLRLYHKSLLPPMVAHFAYNTTLIVLVTVAIAFAGPQANSADQENYSPSKSTSVYSRTQRSGTRSRIRLEARNLARRSVYRFPAKQKGCSGLFSLLPHHLQMVEPSGMDIVDRTHMQTLGYAAAFSDASIAAFSFSRH